MQRLYWQYAGEPCDGIDNDLDGLVDEDAPDTDGDGVCDALEVEVCNGIDDNGDGRVDEGHDRDADGVGDCFETCEDSLTLCSGDPGATLLPGGGDAFLVEPNPRWTAAIDGAAWVWDSPVAVTPERDYVASMSTEFELPPNLIGGEARLTIAADNAYGVWVNGKPTAGDMSSINYERPDTWDLTDRLQSGDNRIQWRVLNEALPGSTPQTNPGGLLYCLEIDVAYAGPPETCNGLDDDCDGVIDEGFVEGERYTWTQNGGGHTLGNWGPQVATFDSASGVLTFSTTILDNGVHSPDGFTVAFNNGPNPKGHAELALFYFDGTVDPPVVTAYAYNGQNLFTSYFDGGEASGTQPPDPIASSLVDDFVIEASRIDDGNGVTMSMTIDTEVVNAHMPLYVASYDWLGAQWDDRFGIWYHPVSGLNASYDDDGLLTQWSFQAQAWIDAAELTTTSEVTCAPE
jgi:hypothetical protein